MISSLCPTHGSNNLPLHHSFDLMSSLIDYIFMKSIDKCVVIIINLMSSSRISIEFMMRNTILAPMICVIFDHFIAFCSTQTCLCFVLYLDFLATQHCSSLPWILPPFMSRMSWEFHHLLRILGIVILLTITILSWSSCGFQPGYQQVNGAVWILHF